MALFGSKSILGVDLGTAGIKIVELLHLGEKFELKNYGLIDFIAQIDSGLKLDDQMFISGLKELAGRIGIKTKEVVASIPSFSTFATVIELPYLSEKDLEKAIPYEARKYIPIPLDEVIIDWSIVNVSDLSKYQNSNFSQNQYPNVEVFLAAVPKEETERYKSIFLKAGFNLKALELENIALIRSLVAENPSPLIIVNFGGRSTSITVVDKNFERISRNFELGGFEITKALSRAIDVGFERAEQIKKLEGIKDLNSPYSNAILPLIDMIVFEAKKIISNYEENKKVKINMIILTGGQANLPGINDYFAKKLEREIVIGDPFKKISFNKELTEILKNLGPSLAVAVGLAMRKIK